MIRFFTKTADWINAPFTLGVIALDADMALKIAAFLFVTLPLGVVQWWNLRDKFEERRARRNASRK